MEPHLPHPATNPSASYNDTGQSLESGFDGAAFPHSRSLSRLSTCPSHFRDPGALDTLAPTDEVTALIARELCTAPGAGFFVVDVSTEFLSSDGERNIDALYRRGIRFTLNTLTQLLPALRMHGTPDLFPAKEYVVWG